MGKHLDWSRISPDIAIWCQTMEEDMDFHQACEEHGILWMAGDRSNPDGKYCISGHCAMRDGRTDSAIIPYSDLLVEDKPNFCEILGVEPSQPFSCHGYPNRNYPPMVYQDGVVRLYDPAGQKRHKVGGQAITWMIDHPESVTQEKGYMPHEVAFAAAEDKPAKSHLAEILGVEEDEEWEESGLTFRIHDGRRQVRRDDFWDYCESEAGLSCIINHLDRIIRKPRFTSDELAMLRCFAAVGVVSIKRIENGDLLFDAENYGGTLWPNSLLQTIRPGESVEISEVLK